MKNNLSKQLALYFVMGSTNCVRNPEETVKAALDGGVTFFQLREKGENSYTGQEMYEFAKRIQSLCQEYGVPFIINDDLELAVQLDADGVHVGQEDTAINQVRRKIGPNKILGVSAHNVEEALAAVKAGADYLGVGPMYSTTTKLDVREVKGPTIIKQVREAGVMLPIVGIGGITEERVAPVIDAGANGVAVISAISQSSDPRKSAKICLDKVLELKKSV